MVVVIPHNTHFEIGKVLLDSGKNVVREKPMTITVKEVDELIQIAEKNKLMLSVFHNRRWDGDFKRIKELVNSGLIGEVFRTELYLRKFPSFWRLVAFS